MKCYLCGHEIHDEARFCAFCGADQSKRPVETVNCCHCGKPIKPTARFCAFCGSAQEISAVEEASPVESAPEIIADVESVVPADAEIEIFEEASEEKIETVQESVDTPDPVEETAESEVAEETEKAVEEPAEEVPAAESIPEPAPEPVPAPQPVPVQSPAPQAAPYIPQPTPQPAPQPANFRLRPAFQLPTKRSLVKMIFLGLITFGIYDVVIMSRIVEEMNITSSRYDGRCTQQLMWMLVLAPLTLGIYPLVWIHGLCDRIGNELNRRSLNYKFGAGSFWMLNLVWPMVIGVVSGIAGAILSYCNLVSIAAIVVIVCAVGAIVPPFIYTHKLMHSMNLINADYNING